METGKKFNVRPDQSLAYLQYRVLDAKGNEIDLKEEKTSICRPQNQKAKPKTEVMRIKAL